MGVRPFARLTNIFSEKIESPATAVALHFIRECFARIDSTLRNTLALAAGIPDHVWSYEEITVLPN